MSRGRHRELDAAITQTAIARDDTVGVTCTGQSMRLVMGSPDVTFDTSAALAILDCIVDRDEAVVLHSVASAWEAAWIACLTNSPGWTSVAEDEFGHVVVELHGMLWTVDPHKVRSTPLGLGEMSQGRQGLRSIPAESFGAVHKASVARFEPGPL